MLYKYLRALLSLGFTLSTAVKASQPMADEEALLLPSVPSVVVAEAARLSAPDNRKNFQWVDPKTNITWDVSAPRYEEHVCVTKLVRERFDTKLFPPILIATYGIDAFNSKKGKWEPLNYGFVEMQTDYVPYQAKG
jgi:hypothetical protein